ncbi:hypothetical protein HK102_010117 [Quaeritorhiza haematococci]|nr:hypothetical protein HK102_010117 [Quaeritorhiza haematococci]
MQQHNQKEKINVGILGATGTVGQRFIQLLSNHPYFKITAIAASSRSANKSYYENTQRSWKLSTPCPPEIAAMEVTLCDPDIFAEKGVKVVFSGLDASVAGDIEEAFLKKDSFAVFSNAKNHRMRDWVPLCVPLVNTQHMDIIPTQQKTNNLQKGFLVTNANCSTTGMVVALKALQDAFGPLEKVIVTTLQAISGAGYPGVPSLDIFDNIVPFIGGEEDKLETEPLKILGSLNHTASENISSLGLGFVPPPGNLTLSATCNRVPVIDGHTECVSIQFQRKPAPTPEQVIEALESYRCEAQDLDLPSAPPQAIVVKSEPDRPQPRLDRDTGKGQAVVVGRVRKCNVFDIKFTLLSHNTMLGAAGSSVLNAEVAVAKGLIV